MRAQFGLALTLFALALPACGDSNEKPPAMVKEPRPLSSFALRNRARLHGQRESEEGYLEASRLLDQLLLKHPDDLRALMDRARCAVQIEKKTAEALVFIERIDAAKIPTSQTVAFTYLRGIVAKRNQNYALALKCFETVVASVPGHQQARYQAGLAAEKTGKHKIAKTHYEYLLEYDLLVRPASYRLSRVFQNLGNKEELKRVTEIFQSRSDDGKPETEFCSFLEPSPAPFVANESKSAESPLEFVHSQEGLSLFGGVAASIGHGPVASDFADLDNNGTQESVEFSATGATLAAAITSTQPFPVPQTLGVKGWRKLPHGSSEISLLDVDHDGDLDVIFMASKEGGSSELVQLRNLGNSKFEFQSLAGFVHPALPASLGLAANDFDSGNDIDLVAAGVNGAVTVIMNLRDEKWSKVELPGSKRSHAVAADFNGDGLPDILGLGRTPGVSLFINGNTEKARSQALFEKEKMLATGPGRWTGGQSFDFDNDGDLDCLLWGEGLCVLRNRGAGTFDVENLSTPKGLVIRKSLVLGRYPGGKLTFSYDDLESDLLHTWTLEAPQANRSVAILLDGRKDNRDGIGAIVEVFAGGIHTTRMVEEPGPLHFGIGSEELDGFAIRWPQGIRQQVVGEDLEAMKNGLIKIKQKQGLVASCPFLFTKTSKGWKFKSDVVGIAPLDEWLPPGQAPVLDPEEFIRLDQDELKIEGGRVHLAITEELREITYLDRVELYYLDLDPKVLVLSDESTRQKAYGPLTYFTTNENSISKARSVIVDSKDVSKIVSEIDGNYLHAYTEGPSQFQGWGPRQEVELLLNKDARALLLWGRLAWYDSSTSYAMAQAELTWESPRIEILGDDGSWKALVPDIGFPAGMDRSLLVSFPRKLKAGRKIRLVANQRFLWDRLAFLSEFKEYNIAVEPHEPIRHQGLGQGIMVRAELSDRGYSVTSVDTELHEQDYLWRAEPRDEFPRPRGLATAYGDVKDRLSHHDDDFCILVSADSVAMEFEVKAIPDGLKRVWFLRVTGWAKESSFHNRTGRDIQPLPAKSMAQYPPKRSGRGGFGQARAQTRRVGSN